MSVVAAVKNKSGGSNRINLLLAIRPLSSLKKDELIVLTHQEIIFLLLP